MGRIQPKILRGFRDYLPEVERHRRAMLDKVRAVFESFGYGPLETPALEYAEILTGKYGDEGDKLLYRFTDNGDRDVALRYDLTVPLARVVGMHGQLVMPFRRYQIAPVWRAEKPAKGRFREFLQCDADLVGEASVRGDAEIMALGLEVLKALALPEVEMRVNDRRILDGVMEKVEIAPELRVAVLRAVDKLPKIGEEAVRRELKEVASLSDEAMDMLFSLLGREIHSPADLEALGAELEGSEIGQAGIQGLGALLAAMETGGWRAQIRVDLTIARGLDYYTSTIYETFLVGHENYGSIMSGGRYDGLLDVFSKKSQPAVGISLGVDRLFSALTELELLGETLSDADLYVCLLDEADFGESLKLATMLRRAGLRVETALGAGRIGRQLKQASRRGCRWAVLQGEDEKRDGVLVLRDLEASEQRRMTSEELEVWASQLKPS